jgi:hypothetical protein
MENIDIKNILQDFQIVDPTFTRMEIIPVFYSFFMCVLTSFILRFFYIKYANSIAGKINVGNVLPILSSIVFLVILVVKSSLALSLGLVGALSIVRFRTPIKEPEELVYLFLAIAIGLGCAANYVFITLSITIFILIFIYFFISEKKLIKGTNEYTLMITWVKNDIDFNQILEIFRSKSSLISLIRFSANNESNSVIFLVESNELDIINSTVSELKKLDEKCSVTITPPNTSW